MLLSRLFARNALRDIHHITQQSTTSRLCIASHSVPESASRPFGAILSWRGYATDVVEDVDADTTVIVKKRTRSPRTKDPKETKDIKNTKGSATRGRGRPKSTPKVETEEEKIKQKIALHKRHALLDQPRGLPTTAWQVYISQQKGHPKDMRTTSEAYKDLSFSDKEVCNVEYAVQCEEPD